MDDVHGYYEKCGKIYPEQKLQHAIASVFEVTGLQPGKLDKKVFKQLLEDCAATKEWIVKNIYESRAKDYKNEFRKMVYGSTKEMDNVLGKLEENTFIFQQKEELKQFKKDIARISKDLHL